MNEEFAEAWRELLAQHIALIELCVERRLFTDDDFNVRRMKTVAMLDQKVTEEYERAWKERPGEMLMRSIMGAVI